MKVERFLFVALCALGLMACNPKDPVENFCELHMYVSLPESCQLIRESIMLEDRNMSGKLYRFTGGRMVGDTCVAYYASLPAGFYSCTFNATVKVSDGYSYPLRAYNPEVTIKESTWLTMDAFVLHESKDFVLAEIFFAGTQTPEGKNYLGDKYFVLVNNTDSMLYADGIVLVESKFKNTQKITTEPDIMSYAMAVDAIYRVPGDGTRFPVVPGGSFLIADNAMDHRTINSNSFDMSDAKVEWYDVSTNASVTDIDNPDVPNMDKIYCYTLTIWVPNNQGNTTFAIGRMPKGLSDSVYLKKYRYDYNYSIVTQAGEFHMSNSAYRFPNAWIIDAVNMCPHSAYQWLSVHESLDAGYAFVGETGSDKTRFGKCVRRKKGEDGKLIDTNNSSEDFEMAQEANPHYFKN